MLLLDWQALSSWGSMSIQILPPPKRNCVPLFIIILQPLLCFLPLSDDKLQKGENKVKKKERGRGCLLRTCNYYLNDVRNIATITWLVGWQNQICPTLEPQSSFSWWKAEWIRKSKEHEIGPPLLRMPLGGSRGLCKITLEPTSEKEVGWGGVSMVALHWLTSSKFLLQDALQAILSQGSIYWICVDDSLTCLLNWASLTGFTAGIVIGHLVSPLERSSGNKTQGI